MSSIPKYLLSDSGCAVALCYRSDCSIDCGICCCSLDAGDGPAITGKLRAANDTVKATLLFKDVTQPEPPPEEPKSPVQPAQTPMSRQRSAPKWDPVDDLVIGSYTKLMYDKLASDMLFLVFTGNFGTKTVVMAS